MQIALGSVVIFTILILPIQEHDISLRLCCFFYFFHQHLLVFCIQTFGFLQFSSVAQSCPTLCDPMNCSTPASLSFTNSWSLPKPMSIESVMPSSHRILCRPLLLPPILPSIRVFSNESTLRMRWPKYWSFSFSISPSNEHPGLISLRMDWLDLLAVQRTLKSLLQHHSSKASILWCSAFFTVQLSHEHWKNHSLDQTDLCWQSNLFNMLSRLVITFLARSKHLLISWLQSPSAVILELKEIKSDTVSVVSPYICYEVMGQDAMILVELGFFRYIYSLAFYSFCCSVNGAIFLIYF